MIKLPFTIRLEQAVYGSFPFWHRGYAILAHSAGCRPEWLAEMRNSCQRCGEPPASVSPAASLFALRLACGPWAIVGVHPQGPDDQGRPGAMAFHALFVRRCAYRWIGADPFVLAGALHHDWTSADRDRILPTLTWAVIQKNHLTHGTPISTDDPRAPQIIQALAQGRRVVVQSREPIDELARSIWRNLPASVRRKTTVATWAFDNINQFNLVALPKLAGVAIAAPDLILAQEKTAG